MKESVMCTVCGLLGARFRGPAVPANIEADAVMRTTAPVIRVFLSLAFSTQDFSRSPVQTEIIYSAQVEAGTDKQRCGSNRTQECVTECATLVCQSLQRVRGQAVGRRACRTLVSFLAFAIASIMLGCSAC